MVIPHKTLCYGDSKDPEEDGIPMCTLRNFPNLIEHCIEWGRAQFNSLFTDRAQDAVSYIENPTAFYSNLKSTETSAGTRSSLEEIMKVLKLKSSADFSDCVQVARDLLDENFDYKIKDLLAEFPLDSKDKHGQPFWSGPKRAPEPITFDPNDTMQINFISACANLIAFNLEIQ